MNRPIKEYEKSYGKIKITDVFAVTEDGIVFKTSDNRYVEGCLDGTVRVSAYAESWTKWLDSILYLPSQKPELATNERIIEAKKSIESPKFIGDFQHGAFGDM